MHIHIRHIWQNNSTIQLFPLGQFLQYLWRISAKVNDIFDSSQLNLSQTLIKALKIQEGQICHLIYWENQTKAHGNRQNTLLGRQNQSGTNCPVNIWPQFTIKFLVLRHSIYIRTVSFYALSFYRFWAGPNILCQTKNWTAFSATPNFLCRH